MIKFNYPDGSHCYRALHSVQAVYTREDGKLVARTLKPDSTSMYEFEIVSFELLTNGVTYS